MNRSLAFDAVIENVRDACAFVAKAAQDSGLDSRAVYHCEVAVDEIYTNIVEHGYPNRDPQAPEQITISAHFDGECLVIVISDNSTPFDPTSHEMPDIKSEVYKRKPGGWGIYFAQRLMDAVDYEFRNGYNRLHLTKCAPGASVTTLSPGELNIEVSEADQGYWMLKVAGRLDGTTSKQLANHLNDQAKLGHHFLIADLSGVDYISSSGLKVLAAGWHGTQKQQGKFVLTGLRPHVLEVFDMVGFTTFFEIYRDTEQALTNA